MSTLGDLVRARTALDETDLDWLHRLVAEWQLIGDLAFSDLLLHARTREGEWVVVAHLRPTTGPTTRPADVVGETVRAPDVVAQLHRAASGGGRLNDDGEAAPARWYVPVRRGGQVVAVLVRESGRAEMHSPLRMPSQLELTYLTTAGELLQMVSEGRLPFRGPGPDPERAPRVGDGLVRLDGTGHVVYASPNALSAYRRLGVPGDLLGAHLGSTVARLSAGPGRLDEPRGSAALAAVLRFGEVREAEVEAHGATVLLRALPLLPGGVRRGAVVLVRDVTELRSRELQLLGKDATIREIHHRVKNNLQSVAALLRLQARRVDAPEARTALLESVRRVGAIAIVHEALSQAVSETVDFDAACDQVLAMCADLAAPESPVLVRREGSFGELPSALATALAMVLAELSQNAVEHAYPGGASGEVVVRVQRATPSGALVVEVLDDGAGLPPGFTLAASPRLGLQISRALVAGELRGELVLGPRAGGGTRARVSIGPG